MATDHSLMTSRAVPSHWKALGHHLPGGRRLHVSFRHPQVLTGSSDPLLFKGHLNPLPAARLASWLSSYWAAFQMHIISLQKLICDYGGCASRQPKTIPREAHCWAAPLLLSLGTFPQQPLPGPAPWVWSRGQSSLREWGWAAGAARDRRGWEGHPDSASGGTQEQGCTLGPLKPSGRDSLMLASWGC